MRYVWIAVMAVSAVPLLLAGVLLNPIFLVVLGSEWWREWRERMYPYRWGIAFSGGVFVFSLTVFTLAYA